MRRVTTLKPRVAVQGARVQVTQPGSWRAGKNSTQRGYGYRWQKERADYLEDNPLCVMCACAGLTTPATVVDHVIPHRGDQRLFWDRANWQSLCAPCHSGEKQRQEQQA